MISGISSGHHPNPFIQQVKPGRPEAARPEDGATEAGKEPDLTVPEGDEKSLLREFRLFDLALREFDRLIPRIEVANAVFE